MILYTGWHTSNCTMIDIQQMMSWPDANVLEYTIIRTWFCLFWCIQKCKTYLHVNTSPAVCKVPQMLAQGVHGRTCIVVVRVLYHANTYHDKVLLKIIYEFHLECGTLSEEIVITNAVLFNSCTYCLSWSILQLPWFRLELI